MTFIPLTGASSGGSKPSNWTVRERLRNITKALTAGSSLDLRFAEKFFYQNDALYPAMELMATHSRTSSAWYPNWDFKSGSEVGRLVEYGADERRYGDYGALDEGASTNQIRNPRFEGAALGVIGSGGALPANLTMPDFGAQVEVLATGTVDGWPRLRLRVSGTPTSFPRFFLEDTTAVSVSQGQTWTGSLGMALVGGSWSNVSPRLRMLEYTSGAGYIAEWAEDIAVDGSHRRFSQTHTIATASSAYARFDFYMYWTSGAVDFTIDLFLPQLEQSATATSPILPTAGTPAAATRAADVVSGVTTDRASRGWLDTEWDRSNGGVCGDLLEFLPGVPRVGPQGLLVEEGSTNHLANPRLEGGGASAVPTGFSDVSNNIGSAASFSYGYENGWPYMEIVSPGAISGGQMFLSPNTDIPASAGEDWVFSLGARVLEGDVSVNLRIRSRNSAGSSLGSDDSAQLAVDAKHRRFHHTTPILASGAFVQPSLVLSSTGAARVRIYAPQLEQKAYPTSVVLPEAGSPAAATRASEDTLDIAHGPWANGGGEFTVYLEATGNSIESNYPTYVSVGTDANNFVSLAKNAAGNDDHYVSHKNAGISEMAYDGGPPGADSGSIIRFAMRARDNDARYVLSIDGVTDTVTDTAISFGGLTEHKLGLGSSLTAAARGSLAIQSLRYWPTGLADSELEALVA